MSIISVVTHRFVKSEDLNHHGTLFAGRMSEWFVESGLMAVAAHLPPRNIVCVRVHGMNFTQPVDLGETVKLESKAVYAGNTSVTTNTSISVRGTEILNGFITFVNVDVNGNPQPHGLEIAPEYPDDITLRKKAEDLLHTNRADKKTVQVS